MSTKKINQKCLKKIFFINYYVFLMFLSFSTYVFSADEIIMLEEQESINFDPQKINKVEVKVDNSNINIHSDIDDNAEVNFKKIKYGNNHIFNINLDEGILKIEACKARGDNIDFETYFDLNIPTNSAIEVVMGGGSISVTGCRGELKLSGGNLQADINSPIRKLDVKVGTGKLDIQGLEGDINLNMGSGKVNINYLKIFNNIRNIDLKMGQGNAYVYLPHRSSVFVSFPCSSRSNLTNEFFNTQINLSDFYVNGKIASGALSVKKNNE